MKIRGCMPVSEVWLNQEGTHRVWSHEEQERNIDIFSLLVKVKKIWIAFSTVTLGLVENPKKRNCHCNGSRKWSVFLPLNDLARATLGQTNSRAFRNKSGSSWPLRRVGDAGWLYCRAWRKWRGAWEVLWKKKHDDVCFVAWYWRAWAQRRMCLFFVRFSGTEATQTDRSMVVCRSMLSLCKWLSSFAF